MEKKLEPSLRFKDFNDVYKNYVLNDVLDLLTDFESNGSFASVKENVNIYEEKNYAWYVRATDLENNSSLDKVKYVDEHSYKFLKKTPLFGDELLITKRGEIGKVYFFKSEKDVKATVAPNMYLLKLNMLVDSKYVYYSFINNDGNKKLKRINASTTIGALYKDDVKSIKVRFPKIEEQQKIASFLTDVDDRITKLTKKKELLEHYKKGVMQKIFNQKLRFKDDEGNEFPEWEVKMLGDVFTFKQGFQFGVEEQSETYFKGSVEFIRIINVTSDKNDKRYVLDPGKEHHINKEDLFMVRYGDAGRVANGFTGIIANNMFRLLPNFDINKLFFFYNLGRLYNKIHSLSGSSTMPAISFSTINKLKIIVPSLEEQTKIANFLSDIDIKIEVLNTKIENSKTFKKGLLQQMFV
ncbi:restriction endonuclease subunit S [Polaribacter marinaquae]|uniref:Restriction endonuclease subunit S n=1 Tax=Polaribacter marinaquae TaxID=1642819 RepID=A0ABZ2TQE5_9FLAO